MGIECPKCGSTKTAKWGSNLLASGRTQKIKCRSCGKDSSFTRYAVEEMVTGTLFEKPRYVVTAAVNATLVHKPFLASLEKYCDENNAQLLIIPLRYRNPTRHGEDKTDDWFDPKTIPYLYSQRGEPIPGVRIMGDIKTQPTAMRPLSGLDSLTGTACGVFGHTKVALESVATKGQELPKLLYTTGAVTKADYSDTKAGKKGEFHHTLGAVVIERDGDLFHLRHILGQQNGSFYDLDRQYTPEGSTKYDTAAALIAGDIHAERHDPDNLTATFTGPDSITATLKPKRIILHDVLDFCTASHHNDWFERFRRHHSDSNDVREELWGTYQLMDKIAEKASEVVVVDSNHHNHFLKWLSDEKNGADYQNAEIFAETRAGILPEIKSKGFCDPFEWWARSKMKAYNKTKFLKPNESYTVYGIELGYHGDIGSNGARGSALNLSRIGSKTVIGHSHTPRIVDGCYQTGTSSLLDLSYNQGPSSWLHSHVVIYPNGKRTHIHVINGRWRA